MDLTYHDLKIFQITVHPDLLVFQMNKNVYLKIGFKHALGKIQKFRFFSQKNLEKMDLAESNSSHPVSKNTRKAASAEKMHELADNFYYDPESFIGVDKDLRNMDRSSFSLHHSFGFKSDKRNNIHFLDEQTLLTAIGNVLVVLDTKTLEHRYILGLREGSIGAITVIFSF